MGAGGMILRELPGGRSRLGEERDAAQVEVVGGVRRGLADGLGDGEVAAALLAAVGVLVSLMLRSASTTMRAIIDDRLDRVLAHGRLAGEHHGVGAVVNRIGHVGDLGARGARILDHRLQHLRGRDHRLAELGGAADDVLLNRRNLLRRHLHAQVAARHHDGVGNGENGVQIARWPAAFPAWR